MLFNGQVFAVFGNSVAGSSSATRTSTSATSARAISTSHANLASSVLMTSASKSPLSSRVAVVEGSSSKSSSSPSSTPPSSGLGSSAKIGIGLGVPLGLLICAILGFLGFRYKGKLKRSSKAQTSERAAAVGPDPHEDSSIRLGIQSTPEMEGIHRPGEMDACGDGHLNGGVPRRQEMAGTCTPGEMWTPYNTHEWSTLGEVRELEARRKSRGEPSGELG